MSIQGFEPRRLPAPVHGRTGVSSAPVRESDGDRGLLNRLGWGAYQALVAAGLVLAGPVLMIRRGGHHLPTVRGRLTLDPYAPPEPGGIAANGGGLWVHAVSVGEVGVAATLARALPGGEPRLVTTVTPTGQARARAAFAGCAAVAYLPFDLGFAVRRFFHRFAPEALVMVEGDYWPLLLREAARRGVPVAVGPSMENFREMAAEFDRRGAWERVADGEELGRTWQRWLDAPESARTVGERGKLLVEENRGALRRTLQTLEPMLERIRD